MAILDLQSLFSNAQAVTGSAASTNYYDKLAAMGIGKGNPIPLLVQVVVAFNTLTSITVTVEQDADVAFGSPTTIGTSGAILLASLVIGYIFPIFWLPKLDTERYLRLYYTVGGSSATLGKITAGVTSGHQSMNWD